MNKFKILFFLFIFRNKNQQIHHINLSSTYLFYLFVKTNEYNTKVVYPFIFYSSKIKLKTVR